MSILKTIKHSILIFFNQKESIKALDSEISFKDALLSLITAYSIPIFLMIIGLTILISTIEEELIPGISNYLLVLLGIPLYIIFITIFTLIGVSILHLILKLFGAEGTYLDTIKGILVFYTGYIFIAILLIPIMFLMILIMMIPILGTILYLIAYFGFLIWLLYIIGQIMAQIHKIECWKVMVSVFILVVIFFLIMFIIGFIIGFSSAFL